MARLETFGAFIELAPGLEGLVHISEMGAGRRLNHSREAVQLGQDVQVRVLGVDTGRRRISLSMGAGSGAGAGMASGGPQRAAAAGGARSGRAASAAAAASAGAAAAGRRPRWRPRRRGGDAAGSRRGGDRGGAAAATTRLARGAARRLLQRLGLRLDGRLLLASQEAGRDRNEGPGGGTSPPPPPAFFSSAGAAPPPPFPFHIQDVHAAGKRSRSAPPFPRARDRAKWLEIRRFYGT